MQLELRHLQAVCRIAEAGSLGGAARRLGVSQPALSAQLRRIERVTGGELFVRGRNGVEPTALGQFVLAKARRVLSEMDALGAEAREIATGAPLRLGCILLVLLDGLLARTDLSMAGQEITVDLEDSVTALARMLGAGQYDAIVYGEVNDHEVRLPPGALARTLVAREPFCIRLSAGHALARRERIDLAELAAESWMTLVEDDDGGPEALVAACAQAGFSPSLRYRIADRKMHYDLIAAGRAVSLSQPTAPTAPGTVMRPLGGEPITGRIRLAWNRATVSARQAELLYRAAALAYVDNVGNQPFHKEWWDAHPEFHPVLD
ncbi:LysR family transcriptional regulator [Streptomyces subrutilus]|uniref:LysR family transcriptional regulator n=1 Tax=Streptomyces subrutilus TaxID=36818 RepID=A0A5P2UDP3_9ACTN|nr:LysR family transcriptional regulator [Streptomyces subrutilus]QEU77078.1 LysR family transcriptional regulator [Streptomyces subrutilus]WSJ33962.1 LysR family transcriptional regulator [Streptomyces subrutilus]GGZ86367.1 LysR family transcriptional regulator [Streptomyces subrutilus]